jgi:pimeloyl-ACP methyl ester carboxylesterase
MVALAVALNHPDTLRGVVLLSGYYYPSLRTDVLLSLLPAIPIIGDLLRFTVSPLVSAAMLPRLFRKMFAPLLVPKSFADRFLDGLPIRPSQIRAESQDGVTMIPAALAMRHRYHDLQMPLIIMAGDEDEVVDRGQQAVRIHQEIPHSTLRLVPNAGHMFHYAVPDQVAEAVNAVAGGPAPVTDIRPFRARLARHAAPVPRR